MKNFPASAIALFSIAASSFAAAPLDEPRHHWGICWQESPHNNLAFARQMGYGYVFYQTGMENDPEAHDMKFIIESPEYLVYSTLGITRMVNRSTGYTQEQKDTYTRWMANKDRSAFPNNLADGYHVTSTTFYVEPDYQQQKVVKYFVDSIMALVRKIERPDRNFRFGGFAWDVTLFAGDFWSSYSNGTNKAQITLAYWTGSDASILVPGTTHEYATYSDGKASYWSTLFNEALKINPTAIRIFEPWQMVKSWVTQVRARSDASIWKHRTMIEVEGPSRDTIDIAYASEMIHPNIEDVVARDWVGSASCNKHTFPFTNTLAGTAGVNGLWFNWFGRFGGFGADWTVPADHDQFSEVPSWLLLARVLPGWDNLSEIPLNQRSYSAANFRYQSTNSRFDSDVLYSRHPVNRNIFAVFFTQAGQVALKTGEMVQSIYSVDELFIEVSDVTSRFNTGSGVVTMKNASDANKGFIIKTTLSVPVLPAPAARAPRTNKNAYVPASLRSSGLLVGAVQNGEMRYYDLKGKLLSRQKTGVAQKGEAPHLLLPAISGNRQVY